MSRPPVTEFDLQVYLDAQLSEARRADVEEYLAGHPQDAQRIADYRVQNEALREFYAPVLEEPVPDRLSATLRARGGFPVLLRYAAIAACMALSGVAGWHLRGWSSDAAHSLVALPRQAAVAHAVYSPEVRHPVEVGAEQEAHLVSWLSKRLGTPLKLPHLTEHGYALVGGRLLPGETGPVAQFMFQDARGQRLTLYVHNNPDPARETAFRFTQVENVRVFYWIDQKLGYALSGEIEKNELLRVANTIYRHLNP